MILGKEFYIKQLKGDADYIYPQMVGHLIGIMGMHDIEAGRKGKETLQDIQNLLDAFNEIKKAPADAEELQENFLPDNSIVWDAESIMEREG